MEPAITARLSLHVSNGGATPLAQLNELGDAAHLQGDTIPGSLALDMQNPVAIEPSLASSKATASASVSLLEQHILNTEATSSDVGGAGATPEALQYDEVIAWIKHHVTLPGYSSDRHWSEHHDEVIEINLWLNTL